MHGLRPEPIGTAMLDILLFPGGLGIFAVLALYVLACERV
jgi:hypothetical protein